MNIQNYYFIFLAFLVLRIYCYYCFNLEELEREFIKDMQTKGFKKCSAFLTIYEKPNNIKFVIKYFKQKMPGDVSKSNLVTPVYHKMNGFFHTFLKTTNKLLYISIV